MSTLTKKRLAAKQTQLASAAVLPVRHEGASARVLLGAGPVHLNTLSVIRPSLPGPSTHRPALCFYSSGMSFDVFLMSFSQEATASVYGLGSEALMFNHIGDLLWDLIVTR